MPDTLIIQLENRTLLPISIYFRELPIVANAETKWFPLPERNTLTGTDHQIIVALCIVEVKNATMPL